MKAIIIILMILSATNFKMTFTDGSRGEYHWIFSLIALVLFCLNY